MKTIIFFILVLLVPVTAFAITAPAKIAYVEGKVLIKRQGKTKPVRAQTGDSIFFGDSVITKRNSRCQLNVAASGIIRLAANTEIYLPIEEKDGVSITRMKQGKTWSNIKRMAKDEIFEVKTPWLPLGTQDGNEHKRAFLTYFASEEKNLQHAIRHAREYGNRKLALIRGEVDRIIRSGESIREKCPNPKCKRPEGPHYWDGHGWTCGYDGYTVASPGSLETTYGSYSDTHIHYAKIISSSEQRLRKLKARNGWWSWW